MHGTCVTSLHDSTARGSASSFLIPTQTLKLCRREAKLLIFFLRLGRLLIYHHLYQGFHASRLLFVSNCSIA